MDPRFTRDTSTAPERRRAHSCRSVEASAEDADLVAAARREPALFTALYRRYVSRLYQYLLQQAGNHQDAEDLTAITFSKALASLSRYREEGSFAAWLFSIARHSLRDHQRRRRAHVDLARVAATEVDPAPTVETLVIQAEQARKLHRLIRALPADQRVAIGLRFFGQLRSAEIARVLDRSEGAVRMLLHRALQRLRRDYEQEDER